jgi:hypothetical protein
MDSEDGIIDVSCYVSSSDLGLALQFGDALGDIIAALSQCNLIEYDFMVRAWNNAFPGYTGTEPAINQHAVFIFDTTTPGNRHSIQLPAVRDSVLTTSPDPMAGITLDMTNTDVIAFRDSLLNGDGTVTPVDYFGDDLTELGTAYQQWRAVNSPSHPKG